MLLFKYKSMYTCMYQMSQVVLAVKNPAVNAGDIRNLGLVPGSRKPLEEGMATHSSIFAWRIPWIEEPGRLPFMGSQRIGHDQATSLTLYFITGEGNGNPLQYSRLENPMDRGAWGATVHGVGKSQTQLSN